jgi:hypothetical protein
MKGLYAGFLLALFACGNGDDTADGTRSECAFGGTLTECPEIDRTPEDACWRLVDCASIPVSSDNANRFDWGHCVDSIESAEDPAERLSIDCIAASSCDQLQAPGSPHDPDPSKMPCFMIGGAQ